MYAAGLLTVALSVLALTEAAPTPGGGYSRLIKLDRDRNNVVAVRSKQAYGLPISTNGGQVLNPHDTLNALEAAKANTRNVRSRYGERALEADSRMTNWRRDFMYAVDVEFGTPPQTFSLHLDTGSASTYLMSKNCTIRACTTNNIRRFDFDASSTFELWNTTARKSLTYGSGFASGLWSNDTVAMGPFKVEKQAFLSVFNTDAGYVGSDASGLLGMAFPSITAAGEEPWWHAAMGQWDDKRFGIYLERVNLNEHPFDTHGNESTGLLKTPGGLLTVGGVAEELYTGEVNYVPVTEQRYWMVDFDGAKVNGNAVTLNGGKRAVLDTGSTLNYFPEEYSKEFFAQIPGAHEAPEHGAGMWALPCKTDAKIQFTFGGVDYDIFPDDFNFAIVDEEQGLCLSQIIGNSPGGMTEFLFGAAFLKNVYTIYRPEPPAVGMAKLVNKGTPYAGWPEYKSNSTTPTSTSGTNTSIPTENPTPSSNSSVSVSSTPVPSSTTDQTPSSSTTSNPSSSTTPVPSSSVTPTSAGPEPSSSVAPEPSSSSPPPEPSTSSPPPVPSTSSPPPVPSSSVAPEPSTSSPPPEPSTSSPPPVPSTSSPPPVPSSSVAPEPSTSSPPPEPSTSSPPPVPSSSVAPEPSSSSPPPEPSTSSPPPVPSTSSPPPVPSSSVAPEPSTSSPPPEPSTSSPPPEPSTSSPPPVPSSSVAPEPSSSSPPPVPSSSVGPEPSSSSPPPVPSSSVAPEPSSSSPPPEPSSGSPLPVTSSSSVAPVPSSSVSLEPSLAPQPTPSVAPGPSPSSPPTEPALSSPPTQPVPSVAPEPSPSSPPIQPPPSVVPKPSPSVAPEPSPSSPPPEPSSSAAPQPSLSLAPEPQPTPPSPSTSDNAPAPPNGPPPTITQPFPGTLTDSSPTTSASESFDYHDFPLYPYWDENGRLKWRPRRKGRKGRPGWWHGWGWGWYHQYNHN
ncbi:hypothetical protein CspeluHIS016_0503040 [Cutaneotrichosporon spelunceum]|uniref:Peptidase A1 domain-containing protein n=1 Tax=Cutaneotrichosporon spelunceum TaxID=1672016 RepID=A0AAD3TXK1_9TREE|nr:hypothetical protein CspeluHIS016_0503040 [Cutaneotrichosporon spelunceum]